MGGLAFAHPGPSGEPALHTPRMPPHVYDSLKQVCNNTISKHYSVVTSLRDAPEKSDYGDIDFLVQGPFYPDANEKIARELGAKRCIRNGLDFTLAIPWSDDASETMTNSLTGTAASASEDDAGTLPLRDVTNSKSAANLGLNHKDPYAQIDIRLYPESLSLDWVSYLHSYGDLGQILGYLAYDLGITSNDNGFYVRIAEQEASNWKASMIFLSSDPTSVMDFLGLDADTYTAGFLTVQQLFDWIITARTACRHSSKDKKSKYKEPASTSGGIGPIKENSDHRRRMVTRPLFARFINDILPTLPLLEKSIAVARKDLLHDALEFFQKQEEYDNRIGHILRANEDEKARLLLVDALMEEADLKREKANEIVRAVKRWLTLEFTLIDHTDPGRNPDENHEEDDNHVDDDIHEDTDDDTDDEDAEGYNDGDNINNELSLPTAALHQPNVSILNMKPRLRDQTSLHVTVRIRVPSGEWTELDTSSPASTPDPQQQPQQPDLPLHYLLVGDRESLDFELTLWILDHKDQFKELERGRARAARAARAAQTASAEQPQVPDDKTCEELPSSASVSSPASLVLPLRGAQAGTASTGEINNVA